MITIKVKGDSKRTEKFINNAKRLDLNRLLSSYGAAGVAVLASATPKDSGLTAMSWDYTITSTPWGVEVSWFNRNIQNGSAIAMLIQYGHGTGTGGYVQGYDYINPAMRPIFDKMADDLWKEVTSL